MKRILITFTLLLSMILSVHAADITSISKAFKEGNATPLLSNMDTEVDIAVPETSKQTNGKETVAMLNKFFATNKPKDFSILHHADKKESGFFVAKLKTSTGEFRVNISYKADKEKPIIQSIRIE